MELDSSILEEYVARLSDNINLVDELSDEVVEKLIYYLESEISRKQKILKELQGTNGTNEYF